MKVNKAGFFVSLVLTLACLIGAVVWLLIPSNCPLEVQGDITTSHKSGYIYVHGTLKNTTDKELEITYMEVVVTTANKKITIYDDERIVVPVLGVLDLTQENWGTQSYETPQRVSEINVTIDGVKYSVYGSNFSFGVVVLFVLAVVFGIVTVSTIKNNKKKQKAYDEITKIYPEFGGAATFSGLYGKEGERAKAIGKTVASSIGAFISALFLGFGTYKIYGATKAVKLLVLDNGLYVVDAENPEETSFIEKGKFPDSVVSTNKNKVVLTNKATKENFIFNTDKKSLTPQELVDRLNEFISYVPEVQPETAQEVTPFEDFEDNSVKPSDTTAEVKSENNDSLENKLNSEDNKD